MANPFETYRLKVRDTQTGEDVEADVSLNLDAYEPIATLPGGRMLGRISDGRWRFLTTHPPRHESSRFPVSQYSVPPR